MQKILIIEDDTDINHLLSRILKKAGYEVTPAFSGTEAQLRLEKEVPNLILLDLMLPGVTGEEVIKYVREELHQNIPIIVISAKTALENKVFTMTMGADDYITKPFEPEEVLVRVMAVLRRYHTTGDELSQESYHYKNLALNPISRIVTVNQQEITLTRHEYDILLILMKQPEKVFSREFLYEEIWQNGYYGEDNTVNVHVSNIRKKIAAMDSETEYIKTVWGIGFKMA
ncbi:response regulator transcription factor [Clostridium sp. Marseille-P299]|uniref:response regulator transcription factor n=1 Tax=Clostridium sp. Marseille-P299 TaxID=1805477 RepID=UPI000834AD1C|nr:response regulator transcription factor [Clostridium sp. Marseille-P299]